MILCAQKAQHLEQGTRSFLLLSAHATILPDGPEDLKKVAMVAMIVPVPFTLASRPFP